MSHMLQKESFGKCLNLDIGKCLSLKILEQAKIAIPKLRSGGKCLISKGQMSHAKHPPTPPSYGGPPHLPDPGKIPSKCPMASKPILLPPWPIEG